MTDLKLPSVVFFGTPEFAVPSLKRLVESGFPVSGVVTAPDKPSGRGLQLRPSPVKTAALSLGLTVLQPDSLKDPEFLSALTHLNPGLQVVVAFRKLPEVVWRLPVLGTFNLHASLLPDYRGAAPINWTLINGDAFTGLTTFLINEDIDAGNLLLSESMKIGQTENAGSLHDRMMERGADLVVETALGLARHSLIPQVQPLQMPGGAEPRPAPKIHRETCRIHWNQPSIAVYNLIRGLSPSPCSFSELMDNEGRVYPVKIYEGMMEEGDPQDVPGMIFTDERTFWSVACSTGRIGLKTVQIPGKKPLAVKELLNGFPLNRQWRFKV